MKNIFQSLNRQQGGFTLIELIVVIAISGAVAAAAGGVIFQLIAGNSQNANAMTAVRQVQQAGHWISQDLMMADFVIPWPNEGPPDISSLPDKFPVLTIYWFEYKDFEVDDGEGGTYDTSIKHKVTYELSVTDQGSNPFFRYHWVTDVSEHESPIDYTAYDEENWTPVSNTQIARHIAFRDLEDFKITPSSSSSSYYDIKITSFVPGFRPAEEARTYEIKVRPD